jgi:hypothetical protein
VPIFGKQFRDASGTGMYNRWIYGTTEIRDQVIPFTGDLFIDLRVPGVLIGFAILGAVLARLQLAFIYARTALGLFVTQYVSMWIAFLIIGSAEVVGQFFVYFMWPIYVVIAYSILRSTGAPRPSTEGIFIGPHESSGEDLLREPTHGTLPRGVSESATKRMIS